MTSCSTNKKTSKARTSQKSMTKAEAPNSINDDFNKYLAHMLKQEFPQAMDYVNPKIFEIIPKDQMIDMMKSVFNNPDMKIKLSEPKILEVKPSKKIEGNYYSKMKYSNSMNIKMKPEEGETAEDREVMSAIMIPAFEQSFGEGNVKHDKETEAYDIYVVKDVIAVSANGASDWKFAVMEKEQMAFLKQLFPAEVFEMK